VVPPSLHTTVLVVEDDPGLRSFYRSVLTLQGYTVISAGDGIDALRRVEEYQPSAIVLDLGLPMLSGRDVGRELAAHVDVAQIPIVVVTGDARGLNPADFACVLRKPVTADALIAAVDDCLKRARRLKPQHQNPMAEPQRERRTGPRCRSCGMDTITRETTVKGDLVTQVWRCSTCEAVCPERRKAS
jgi:DNA-binding response OmpR family regulator